MELIDTGIKKEWIVKNDLGKLDMLKENNQYVKEIFIAYLPSGYTLSVDFLPQKPKGWHGFLSKLSRGDGIDYRFIYHIQGAWSTSSDPATSGLFARMKGYFKDYVHPEGVSEFNKNAYKLFVCYKSRLYTYNKTLLICRDKDNEKELFRKQIGSKEIERIELSPIGNGILIWSKDAADIGNNRTQSLGLYDDNGENLWYAEKEGPDYYKVGFTSMKISDNKLFAHFNYDMLCQIDLKTGNILNKRFTK